MASVALARGSSPHTRGARPAPRHRRRPAGIIPAYAGSTGRRRSCESRRRDHPRIRGEHDGDLSRISHVAGSSPHTRGARQSLAVCRGVGGIIPAYAGSTVDFIPENIPPRDHPRIRGEHDDGPRLSFTGRGSSPHTRGALVATDQCDDRGRIIPAYAGSTNLSEECSWEGTGSSPHTRGARFLSIVFATSRRIIPAYAGSTRLSGSDGGRGGDHPRIRGEHSFRDKRGGAYDGSSPHTRGARRDPSRIPWVSRIIPAYAGSTLIPCSRATSSSDHPRIRGEHCPCDRTAGADRGSSPHTRGARSRSSASAAVRGIIPAYAGSTWPAGRSPPGPSDHPRIRGEHPGHADRPASTGGSSPHTRGARFQRRKTHPCCRIIPAYAGSTHPRLAPVAGRGDHPRIRGEHPDIARRARTCPGSSPHTRGAPGFSLFPRMESRIIPAYAGSTCGSIKWIPAPWDHPRIRGEHLLDGRGKPRNEGSSPHTRGALHSRARRVQEHGIIPAYAGSTP